MQSDDCVRLQSVAIDSPLKNRNAMIQGIHTVAAVVPSVRPANVRGNVKAMIAALGMLPEGTSVAVFPELCVTGATCGDLFRQRRLLDEADTWGAEFLESTGELGIGGVVVFGIPVRAAGRVFDAVAVAQSGRLLGVVPKRFPTRREARWFAPAASAAGVAEIALFGQVAPFGPDLLFRADGTAPLRPVVNGPEVRLAPFGAAPDFCMAVEIGTDRKALPPASCLAAAAGATVVCNPAAEPAFADDVLANGTDIAAWSRLLGAAVIRANAGTGESSSSNVYPGNAIVAIDGEIAASDARAPLLRESTVLADVDTQALAYRRATSGQGDTGWGEPSRQAAPFRIVPFFANPGTEPEALAIRPTRFPFLPDSGDEARDIALRDARCSRLFSLQAASLATRLRNTGIRHVVLGLSGGLDSTLSLLVAHEAFRQIDLDPAEGLHLYTMPGFGTGARTRSNADALAEALGLGLEEIPISGACSLHLRDIGHDGETPDAAYENCQARERTQILMDKANMLGGLVLGTGDLSEIALGWCTFGGDQLSMFCVNAGVPKTLVRAIVAWYADEFAEGQAAADILRDILATPVSPELLPADENGDIAQKTEDVVGPYELHDFFLWHLLRDGADPEKLLGLAGAAFADAYAPEDISHWLQVFLRRFLSQQFKRTASAEGAAVLSVSLDPRDGWQMPGDVSAEAWTD